MINTVSDWGFSTEAISEFNWGPEAPVSAGSTVYTVERNISMYYVRNNRVLLHYYSIYEITYT